MFALFLHICLICRHVAHICRRHAMRFVLHTNLDTVLGSE